MLYLQLVINIYFKDVKKGRLKKLTRKKDIKHSSICDEQETLALPTAMCTGIKVYMLCYVPNN